MSMDWYYEQLHNTKPITWETIDELKDKNYHSGTPIKVGETVLQGLLQENNELKTITFSLRELNRIYKIVDQAETYLFPVLRRL